MSKLLALLDLFRKGSAVTEPELWKNRAALVMTLSGLIIAINSVARAFGHDLHIDTETATAIAGGVAAVAGVLSTYLTSARVGLPARPPDPGDPGAPAADPAAPGGAPNTGAEPESRPVAPRTPAGPALGSGATAAPAPAPASQRADLPPLAGPGPAPPADPGRLWPGSEPGP